MIDLNTLRITVCIIGFFDLSRAIRRWYSQRSTIELGRSLRVMKPLQSTIISLHKGWSIRNTCMQLSTIQNFPALCSNIATCAIVILKLHAFLSFIFSCYYYCLCINIYIDTTRCHNVVNSSSFTKKSASSGYPYYDTVIPRHDDQFDMIQNPIYELASQCNKYNPHYSQ